MGEGCCGGNENKKEETKSACGTEKAAATSGCCDSSKPVAMSSCSTEKPAAKTGCCDTPAKEAPAKSGCC
jgi:hypothetical protein